MPPQQLEVRACLFGKKVAAPDPKAPPIKQEVKREVAPKCLAAPVVPPPLATEPRAKACPAAVARGPPMAVKSSAPPPPANTGREPAAPPAKVSAPAPAPALTRAPAPAEILQPEAPSPAAGLATGALPDVGHDADSGAGTAAANPWDDKSTYNKLNHKLRGADPAVRQAWQDALRTRDVAQIESFMDTVMSHKRGGIPEDFVRKCKRVEKSEETSDDGGWLPWKEVADKEGHDALMEMVTAGTVLTRRHPRLPTTSTIPYPANQQVRYVVERWKTTTKSSEHEDHVQPVAGDQDAVSAHAKSVAAATAAIQSRRGGNASVQETAAPSTQGAGPNATPSERDKTAVANVRKTHSLWDRGKREYTALISKSKACANTQGCKFELDLEGAIKEGIKLDASLMLYETKYMEGKAFTNDDVEKMSSLATKTVELIKESNKRAAALRPWFKV